MPQIVHVTEKAHRLLKELARERGLPMTRTLEEALECYRRQLFLQRSNEAFAALRADPQAWEEELRERREWEGTLADDLEPEPEVPERKVEASMPPIPVPRKLAPPEGSSGWWISTPSEAESRRDAVRPSLSAWTSSITAPPIWSLSCRSPRAIRGFPGMWPSSLPREASTVVPEGRPSEQRFTCLYPSRVTEIPS